jgi:outer membrane protein OmpA-like peptidoglycan-associated protein
MKRQLAILLILAPALVFGAPFDKGGINGVGARAEGMGGAVVAQPGDASDLWWNPAGIALQKDFSLSYQYGSLLGGDSVDQALAQTGELPDLDLSYGLGYRRNLATSQSGYTEQTTLVSGAFPFTDDKRLDFGATIKLYSSQLADVPGGEAHGFGMDLGFLYQVPVPGDGLTLGLSVLDFQTNLDWATGINDNPPQLMQAGASYRLDSSTLAEFDYELVTDAVEASRSSQGFKVGAERWFNVPLLQADRFLALRLGYLQSSALAPTSLSGLFTLGCGLSWRGYSLDYAYMQDLSSLGESHRLSASYNFSPFPKTGAPLQAEAPSPSPTPAAPSEAPRPVAPRKNELALQVDSDVFAPGNGSRRPLANFAISGGGAAVQGFSLAITRQGSLQVLRSLKGRILPKALHWDGRNQQGRVVPDGSYIATLRATLRSGQTLSASVRLDVDTRKPSLGLEAYPTIFDPNDPARALSLSPRTDKLTGIPSRWEILIESLGGARVRLLEGRGSAPEKLQWNGLDDHGQKVPSESLYYVTYNLEMESGALAKSPRLVLGSEITAFAGQSAIKVTLASAKFLPDDEGITLEDYKSLKEAADAVKKYGAEYLVQVLGYADSQEAKGPVGAMELSFLRAKAVRDYLVESGALDPERVKSMGFGAERPSADNATDEGRAKNRKVDVILFTK